MRVSLGLLLPLSAVLSGCVFAIPYERPEDPNSPTIFVDVPDRGGFLYYKNGEDCSGSVELPGEFIQMGDLVKPFPVPGDKMLAIALLDRYVKSEDNETYYVTCTALTSFTPKDNMEYTVQYLSAGQSCGARVYTRAKGSDDVYDELKSALAREPVEAMTAMGAACLPVNTR
ncbi:MAG: hypothetical protein QNJ19_02810 [Woeseiaceae bacterium]|nr:hypothetical protein [Woeseiaceae bacterium]